jgi:GrpB-like predicted nucleotidyltransferase (UPF0157 family)
VRRTVSVARTAQFDWQTVASHCRPSWQHGFVSFNYTPIRVETHDTGWHNEFQLRAAALRATLGIVALRIDHIGSTAVPGLDAKPTIDIQVSVADVDDIDSYRPSIERLGYTFHERSLGDIEHRFFSAPSRAAHVHVCRFGSDWERRHLLFPDYLRTHLDAALRYAALKHGLSRRHRVDRERYAEAKSDFIQAEMAIAEEWASQTGWSAPKQ